ncbi:hypothetical protein RJT34_20077 [Clitoria ternatea]|uniref:Uncharacterized protein n=1 Tax=Clitoria ternatea TaxID=43366 RepID=A0AAN9IS76_CLITE
MVWQKRKGVLESPLYKSRLDPTTVIHFCFFSLKAKKNYCWRDLRNLNGLPAHTEEEPVGVQPSSNFGSNEKKKRKKTLPPAEPPDHYWTAADRYPFGILLPHCRSPLPLSDLSHSCLSPSRVSPFLSFSLDLSLSPSPSPISVSLSLSLRFSSLSPSRSHCPSRSLPLFPSLSVSLSPSLVRPLSLSRTSLSLGLSPLTSFSDTSLHRPTIAPLRPSPVLSLSPDLSFHLALSFSRWDKVQEAVWNLASTFEQYGN